MDLEELETVDQETGQVNAVIESPKGGRNKFTYEPGQGLFRLSKVLPAGAVFPFDMASCRPRAARTAPRWTCWC